MLVEEPAEPCAARLFDLLRKMSSTVPKYADELILLVFTAFLNSDSLSKNKFFDRLKDAPALGASFFLF